MNALMIIPTREEMDVIKWEAEILVSSGFLPKHIQKPQHAIAIMLKGRELGISPWVALTKIHVIQGTPTVAPELMLALIYRSGELEDMHIDSHETTCTVTMKRKGKSPISATFTMENAAKMNLSGKDNWNKQPAVMLKWRAISACARLTFPDVIQGMYTHEEIAPDMHVNEEGELLQAPAYLENGNGNSAVPLPARATAKTITELAALFVEWTTDDTAPASKDTAEKLNMAMSQLFQEQFGSGWGTYKGVWWPTFFGVKDEFELVGGQVAACRKWFENRKLDNIKDELLELLDSKSTIEETDDPAQEAVS